jgi:DNA-binding NarL/FixJ family response regulator
MATETRPYTSDRPARVVIVDDHQLAREGLQRMLAGEPDLVVVGEAATGQEALALCARLRPDLVLMDVRMPDLDGLAATQALRQADPDLSVIIVTMYDDPNYLFQALKAGAAGYLLKDATKQQVVTAVRQVLRGAILLNPELMTHLLRRLARQATAPAQPAPEQLTARELEVLGLLAEGLTNREIAHRLHLGLGTVKVHVGHIIAKLDVVDRTQAAVRAVEQRMLPPAGPT